MVRLNSLVHEVRKPHLASLQHKAKDCRRHPAPPVPEQLNRAFTSLPDLWENTEAGPGGASMAFDPILELEEVRRAFQDSFQLIEPIIVGGQGAVFKASMVGQRADQLPAHMALKVYFPEQLSERTDREIGALRRLTSPNIVKLVDSGRVNLRGVDCVYVATEFIQGEVLSAVLGRRVLSLKQIAKVGSDMASAIAAIWQERIVHRDIKPPNIMLTPDSQAILIDLGVARHLALASLTTPGMTWGTSGYMAPEHALARRQLSCKADVFSLGVVLQECILGQHPTNGRQDLLMGGGPATRTLRRDMPAEFSSIVDSMVNRDALSRPLPLTINSALEPWL